jgi:hypothetical protein
VVWEE